MVDQKLKLNKLYKFLTRISSEVFKEKSDTLWHDSGTIDLYTYGDTGVEPTLKSQMTLGYKDTALPATYNDFSSLPKYMYIKQNSGTTTDIRLSCARYEEIGDLA